MNRVPHGNRCRGCVRARDAGARCSGRASTLAEHTSFRHDGVPLFCDRFVGAAVNILTIRTSIAGLEAAGRHSRCPEMTRPHELSSDYHACGRCIILDSTKQMHPWQRHETMNVYVYIRVYVERYTKGS